MKLVNNVKQCETVRHHRGEMRGQLIIQFPPIRLHQLPVRKLLLCNTSGDTKHLLHTSHISYTVPEKYFRTIFNHTTCFMNLNPIFRILLIRLTNTWYNKYHHNMVSLDRPLTKSTFEYSKCEIFILKSSTRNVKFS